MSVDQSPLRHSYDVVIAGGGMVGISLGLLLSRDSDGACRVLIVERVEHRPAELSYSPSFDARATALSYGSRTIYAAAGLWTLMSEHATAIEQVHVSQRGRLGSTLLDKLEMGWPALGYVIENQWLGKVLMSALRQSEGVSLVSPARVETVSCSEHAQQLLVDVDGEQREISAGLLVVADGADSGLRSQLGIDAHRKNYPHAAVITNVCFSRPHTGVAYERFTDQGPLALLPLSDSEQGEPRAGLVWTLPAEEAEALCEVEDADFLARLQPRFGDRQGAFSRVGRRHYYSLSLVKSAEQVRRRLVIMGNAAHALHPVAGQGFNLALRDCARLASLLAQAMADGSDPGALDLLASYQSQQSSDQRNTLLFSDQLPALFSGGARPMTIARDLGLLSLDFLAPLKQPFIARTAGTFAGAALGHSA